MSVTLIEFLRARLDEEQTAARAASPAPWYPKSPDELSIGNYGWSFGSLHYGITTVDCLAAEASDSEQGKADALHIARWDPARVLAEVAAKRAVLDLCVQLIQEGSNAQGKRLTSGADGGYGVLRALAQAYADHPDFDPAWRA